MQRMCKPKSPSVSQQQVLERQAKLTNTEHRQTQINAWDPEHRNVKINNTINADAVIATKKFSKEQTYAKIW